MEFTPSTDMRWVPYGQAQAIREERDALLLHVSELRKATELVLAETRQALDVVGLEMSRNPQSYYSPGFNALLRALGGKDEPRGERVPIDDAIRDMEKQAGTSPTADSGKTGSR